MQAFDSIKKVGTQLFRFVWANTNKPFQMVVRGEVLDGRSIVGDGLTDDTSVVLHSDDSEEPPELEVIGNNETDPAESLMHPGFQELQWRGDLNVEHYRVQELRVATWHTVRTLLESGRGYYRARMPWLADGTAISYRVTAVDAQGAESAPRLFSTTVVANPPAPKISLSYAAGQVTVSARA